jgi:hypothetical protein
MIGVAAAEVDLETAAEFFELFKTPWEPVRPGRRYRVALSTGTTSVEADVLLLFSSASHDVDRYAGLSLDRLKGPVTLESHGYRFPIYGAAATFNAPGPGIVAYTGRPLDHRIRCGHRLIWRVAYDLFSEIRDLLSRGQPAEYAETPTVEHHIATLRHLLLESGVSFVEVPPRPHGFDFICCLTHDVDFFGIRRHLFDRTMAGFLARASVGSFIEVVRRRRPISEALRNWAACCALPLVMLRILPDLWRPFDDYTEADRGLPSTYFLVPVKKQAGVGPDGVVRSSRGVAYQISEIGHEIRLAAARGIEMAVHGVDAWRDAEVARTEKTELTRTTGQRRAGVRMHWLYFSETSPSHLENAAFEYDSTCGYNDAIGYKPGTSQVFRLPGTEQLMELPLSIMDSALFFRGRMALSRAEALRRCRVIVDNARRLGGTVVINWHDRSLAAERQWREPYDALLDDIQRDNRAWFSTAINAVDWFRWRRSIEFVAEERGRVTFTVRAKGPGPLPATLRIHRANRNGATIEERSFDGRNTAQVAL